MMNTDDEKSVENEILEALSEFTEGLEQLTIDLPTYKLTPIDYVDHRFEVFLSKEHSPDDFEYGAN